MTIAMFTGHRKFASPTDRQCVEIALGRMISRAYELGFDTFISGMALGTDTIAALEVLKDSRLKLIAAVPCSNQDARWQESDRQRYAQLLQRCYKVHYVYDGLYYDGCLHDRNSWMVEQSQFCIAIWDGRKSGGTWHAIRSALYKQIPIICFNPITAEYKRL